MKARRLLFGYSLKYSLLSQLYYVYVTIYALYYRWHLIQRYIMRIRRESTILSNLGLWRIAVSVPWCVFLGALFC